MNIAETVFSFFVEYEKEIALAAHDNEATFLLYRQVLWALDSFDEARESRVVLVRVCVTSSSDDTNFDFFSEDCEKEFDIPLPGAPDIPNIGLEAGEITLSK